MPFAEYLHAAVTTPLGMADTVLAGSPAAGAEGTVDEIDVGKLKEGMPARIKVGAMPEAAVRLARTKVAELYSGDLADGVRVLYGDTDSGTQWRYDDDDNDTGKPKPITTLTEQGKTMTLNAPTLDVQAGATFALGRVAMIESGPFNIGNLRRDANEAVKKLVKDKAASEDEQKRAEADIQKVTDRHIGEIDRMVEAKEQEIMAV